MTNTRKRYTAEFKAKVALEAVRGEVTVQELAKRYKLHAVQIFKWKKQFLENAGRAFDTSEAPATDAGEREAELLKKIGELTIERDFLACATHVLGAALPYKTDAELDRIGLPQDNWRPSWTNYYRYALTWNAIDGVILGRTSAEDIDDLTAEIERGPLTDEELDYLDDLDDLVNGRARLDERGT